MTWATVLYSRNCPIVGIAVATFTNGHRKELTSAERKAFAAEVRNAFFVWLDAQKKAAYRGMKIAPA